MVDGSPDLTFLPRPEHSLPISVATPLTGQKADVDKEIPRATNEMQKEFTYQGASILLRQQAAPGATGLKRRVMTEMQRQRL